MRQRRGFVRVSLILLFLPVYLVTQLLSGIPPASAQTTIGGTPPFGVPEDPLGLQTEQQTPELSVGVDVRSGHLVVRVVDVWGPGRAPLVVRSFTGVGNSPAGAGFWQFNHHLSVSSDTALSNLFAPRADGTLATFRFVGAGTYVKDDRGWD